MRPNSSQDHNQKSQVDARGLARSARLRSKIRERLSLGLTCLKRACVFLQVQKRNFIENVIPIIVSLKTVLEKNKVPALRELMHYLRV